MHFNLQRYLINDRKYMLLLNGNLYLNVMEEEEIEIIKQDQFERNGYLAYFSYYAYKYGIYDVEYGKININYMTILILILSSLGYSGRRSFTILNEAYNFYGTVNKMARQYQQREILIPTRTIERKIEEIPESDEINTLEATPIIQSSSKQVANRNKK